MTPTEKPSADNDYLADHVSLLCDSYRLWTGKGLIPEDMEHDEVGRYLFQASFALVSHNTAADPIFNYANLKAMELFEMEWDTITALPSRLSAEAINQDERARLLSRVSEHGFIDDYTGIRISSSGNRFRINDATVWNLINKNGAYAGQAAMFSNWLFV